MGHTEGEVRNSSNSNLIENLWALPNKKCWARTRLFLNSLLVLTLPFFTSQFQYVTHFSETVINSIYP